MAWAGISGCAVIFVAGFVSQASPASAQTFDSYRCSDGTHFILAFYPQRQARIFADRWPRRDPEKGPDRIGEALFRQRGKPGHNRYRRFDPAFTAAGDGVRTLLKPRKPCSTGTPHYLRLNQH